MGSYGVKRLQGMRDEWCSQSKPLGAINDIDNVRGDGRIGFPASNASHAIGEAQRTIRILALLNPESVNVA
jgi:hypothetical protein